MNIFQKVLSFIVLTVVSGLMFSFPTLPSHEDVLKDLIVGIIFASIIMFIIKTNQTEGK